MRYVLALITFLVVLIGLYIAGHKFYDKFIYEPYPETRHNFIGMTRMEVLEWMDKNGRATKYRHIRPDDERWNKIHLRAPNSCFYDSVDDILNKHSKMNEDLWGIGGITLRHGTILYYELKFKDDKVVEQSDASLSDW